MTTRREVLLQGAVFAAGVVATRLGGMDALAAGAPPLRRSLQGLAWNDPIVATYRDAVGQMKVMAESEKFSWANMSKVHGLDPGHYHYCPHGDWYFLPWHRAFTVMYERVIRHLTHNDAFALPYWDWTADPVMPAVFAMRTTPDGKPNPLFVSDPGFQRIWPANQPMPPEVVGPDVLSEILGALDYESFGTSRNPRQNNLDMSWVVRGGGVQGVLEGTPHNLVHNNIGGWMPSASSSRDPIFFMHHCNIDRIWALWNTHNDNSPESLWRDMVFKDNFYNVDGTFWSPKVSDLFSPETLGYTYNLPGTLVASNTAPERVIALRQNLTALFAAVAPTGRASTVAVVNPGTARPDQPLSVTLQAPPALLQAARAAAPLGSGSNLMGFTAFQERAASSVRVIAFLRDVMVTDAQTTAYRVFIDGQGVSAVTPVTDPHFVGAFGVFNHGMGDAHEAPSFALDLTAALRRVGPAAATPGQLELQIVPIGVNGGAIGTATPARVELSFVSA
jgi:tyrosinase